MLNGIDISSHQAGLNAGTIKADFVIIKVSEGTGYVNPCCDGHYQQAKAAGKLLGIYHYARNSDPVAEADYFLKHAAGYVGEAVLVLDYEENISAYSPTWCKKFLDRVKEKTGIKPLLYTYLNVLQSVDWSSVANADYGLWLAAYGANNPQGYSQPNAPAQAYWKSVAMHQFTSSGRLAGWNGNLDLNVFYGDKAAWLKYAGNKSTSNPAPKPQPATFKYAVGTVVTVGGVFLSSDQASKGNPNDGYVPTARLARNTGKITKQLKTNGVSTYLIDDGLGWINDGDVQVTSTKNYTVKSGDSLWGIADKLYGDGNKYGHLKSLNNLAGDTIYPGQVLKY